MGADGVTGFDGHRLEYEEGRLVRVFDPTGEVSREIAWSKSGRRAVVTWTPFGQAPLRSEWKFDGEGAPKRRVLELSGGRQVWTWHRRCDAFPALPLSDNP